MTMIVPEVVALSYYDGETEGFLDRTEDGQVYFFKVVAWDKNQDKRLYAFGQVSRAIYLELVEILKKSQPMLESSTWVPTWKFANHRTELRANQIVDIGKKSLKGHGFLALGNDLTTAVRILNSAEGLVDAIALASEGAPGNLENWLAQNR